MNILFINHYAGSPQHGMEYRPYYLAREWIKAGHNVTMVAASFTHLHRLTEKARKIRGLVSQDTIDGIRYVWLKGLAYRGNRLGRVFNIALFSVLLYQQAASLAQSIKPQLVIASTPHPFVIFGARKIARRSGARLIFEVRDLWPLTFSELGYLAPRHPLCVAMQWTEDYAYGAADRVVSLLPHADIHMTRRGMAAAKFAYIPIGIDPDAWQRGSSPLPELHRATLNALKQARQFIVGYLGSHGVGDALPVLLEAGRILRHEPVSIILLGDGAAKPALQRRAQELGLRRVFFLPPIQRPAIPHLLAAVDAAYIGWYDKPLYRFGISSNKLMDYMMAARPVIHGNHAANDPVAESGGGISVPPEDPEAVARAIRSLMAMAPEARQAMGMRGKAHVLANHDYRVLAEKYLAVMGTPPRSYTRVQSNDKCFYTNKHSKGGTGVPPVQAQAKACDYIK
jgi:glycosyltransferase involved in cell wall biosynthesis